MTCETDALNPPAASVKGAAVSVAKRFHFSAVEGGGDGSAAPAS